MPFRETTFAPFNWAVVRGKGLFRGPREHFPRPLVNSGQGKDTGLRRERIPPSYGVILWSPRRVSLDRSIAEQSAARQQATGLRPLGVAAVLAQNPLHRPGKIKKSPTPFIHAATKAMRQLLWGGYALFVAAYRSAAERLKAGDPAPPFFVGCFPPALPVVGG